MTRIAAFVKWAVSVFVFLLSATGFRTGSRWAPMALLIVALVTAPPVSAFLKNFFGIRRGRVAYATFFICMCALFYTSVYFENRIGAAKELARRASIVEQAASAMKEGDLDAVVKLAAHNANDGIARLQELGVAARAQIENRKTRELAQVRRFEERALLQRYKQVKGSTDQVSPGVFSHHYALTWRHGRVANVSLQRRGESVSGAILYWHRLSSAEDPIWAEERELVRDFFSATFAELDGDKAMDYVRSGTHHEYKGDAGLVERFDLGGKAIVVGRVGLRTFVGVEEKRDPLLLLHRLFTQAKCEVDLGTSADDLLIRRGRPDENRQIGQDGNGLVSVWTYSDCALTIKRRATGGETKYVVTDAVSR